MKHYLSILICISLLCGLFIPSLGTVFDYAENSGTIQSQSILETDTKKILNDAYALSEGESLDYDASLTGKVIQIIATYDSQFNNISVIISVEGYEDAHILCYRMKGNQIEQLDVSDTITCTGNLKNDHGTIKFAAGCVMVGRSTGGDIAPARPSDPEPSDPTPSDPGPDDQSGKPSPLVNRPIASMGLFLFGIIAVCVYLLFLVARRNFATGEVTPEGKVRRRKQLSKKAVVSAVKENMPAPSDQLDPSVMEAIRKAKQSPSDS